MAQQFYSPMPENKGAALFVSVKPEDQTVVFTLLKQTSYDAADKKGGFAGGKRINVNMSLDETGGIIEAVRNKGEVNIYHTYDKVPTAKGKFNYYEIANPAGKSKRGYGLKVTKDEVEFKVGFTPASAERLAQYLEFALAECFKLDVAEDYKKEAAWQQKKKNTPKPAPKEEEPDPSSGEPVETGSDIDF